MTINRPNTIKVFASDASHGNYLPIKFGTNIPVRKSQYEEVANDNFLFGLESLEGDLQLKDLNSVFFYQGSLLAYLFQQGVPEFSAYQDYPMGAVVQHGGSLWIATKDQEAQKKEPKVDPCDPCGCKTKQDECTVVTEPSKESGWCSFVTHCEYDVKMKELENTNKALQESIDSIKGVESFSILPNVATGALELTLGTNDGNKLVIPMTKFGHISRDNVTGEISISNADGSKLLLPKYVAEKSLDQQKGFYFNEKSEKWEVDLADLVKTGSGLQVDKNGYVSVKPSDLVDGNTLNVNANTGKLEVDPNFAKKLKEEAVDTANDYTDDKLKKLADNGAKVFAEAPIKGTGLKTDPLTLKLSKDFKVQPDGTLVLSGGAKEATTNLNNGTGVMGMSTFYGVVNNTNGNTQYVTGVPVNINSTDHQQNGTTAIGQLATGQNYDFNGWQMATPAQVDQWLIGASDSVWHRTNDSGMNEDGSLKNPSDWGVWTRESNVNIPVQQFQKAIQDILALEALTSNLNQRLTTIENDIVTLWDASGTVKLGRILKAK